MVTVQIKQSASGVSRRALMFRTLLHLGSRVNRCATRFMSRVGTSANDMQWLTRAADGCCESYVEMSNGIGRRCGATRSGKLSLFTLGALKLLVACAKHDGTPAEVLDPAPTSAQPLVASASATAASPGAPERAPIASDMRAACVDICARSKELKCSHAQQCMSNCRARGDSCFTNRDRAARMDALRGPGFEPLSYGSGAALSERFFDKCGIFGRLVQFESHSERCPSAA